MRRRHPPTKGNQMNTNWQTTTVRNKGMDWEVQYKIVGRYYPATETDPAEYPEIYIRSVQPCDTALYDSLVFSDDFSKNYCDSEELNQELCDILSAVILNR